ncbi:rhodanese-like domain-containing protein [Oryzomicrobium sp.]|uniref:rhodanese-like domain-containing protein n=1 Tax=Oryzomicrobium sp. TaxID=1911578 RepID=UPI0025D8A7B8|nr:rhodanese-like domain-containing protein [Oryzomicrobium sp.]MCE1243730.1 sulfurtransferase [Oryzomicrobium sp.]
MFTPAHTLVQAARLTIDECSPAELQARRATAPDTLLLDVREPDEYRQGHIQGALNIPRGLLEFKISSEPALQDVTRPVIVYCKTSGRAALAVKSLQSMGFENVTSLAGGFEAWQEDSRPVVVPRDIAFD